MNKRIKISYSPGFSPDLTSWELTVSETGKIWQHVRISNYDEGRFEEFEKRSKIDPSVAAQWCCQINEIALGSERLGNELCTIDDVPLLNLETDEGVKKWAVTLPHVELTYFHDQPDQRKLFHEGVKLFQEIMSFAPWKDPRLTIQSIEPRKLGPIT